MVLSQEEIDGCRDAFLAFDKDRSGTIDVWELRQVLEAMGQKPTEVRSDLHSPRSKHRNRSSPSSPMCAHLFTKPLAAEW
mmetsp:Transcript_37379/g.101212  ORF Transcript_37379/g.101212 Transcript_37379/m.101212 type:complete len:80 (-) Transcript_37379:546-785(-)